MEIKQTSCCTSTSRTCCIKKEIEEKIPGWAIGKIDTPTGKVLLVNTHLTASDRHGTWLARWTNKRMSYTIPPGLYGVGQPTPDSPVLVTANYKMSFDRLRKELNNINAWILVLDTKGINVWCAAGKGTFSTSEVIKQVHTTQLESIVSHKELILPQLGAPGVAAHQVKKETGFKVIYGPVLARDIKQFLENSKKKTPAMRHIDFPLKERLVLIPIEMRMAARFFGFVVLLLLIFNVFQGGLVLVNTLYEIFIFTGAVVIGSVVTPMLLPWIPGRSFAWKGWLLGVLFAAAIAHFFATGTIMKITYLLILPPISSYLAVNFTGTSTYTSLSGVVKELKIALPLLIISISLGIAFRIYYLF